MNAAIPASAGQFLADSARVDEAAIQPLPNSRKVYVEGSRPDIQVPMREISQDDTPTGMGGEKNPPIFVYDCSGPYSDPKVKIDIRQGLPALRAKWIEERGDTEVLSGLTSDFGRQRAAMDKLARPAITPEFVREEVARGRAIIPANINHPELEPMIIGRNFLVKINANIGNSAVASSIEEEVEKMRWATKWGADTVMDLSTGKNIHATREWILRNSPVPIGTVPIYQALEKVNGKAEDLTWETLPRHPHRAGRAGRRLLHHPRRRAAALRPHDRLPHDRHRQPRRQHHGQVVPRPSQGKLPLHPLGRHLRHHGRLRRLLLHRRRPAPRLHRRRQRQSPVRRTRSPGRAHQIAWAKGVQVMNEGPGHVPMHMIEENMAKQLEWCHEAPFYTLGPLTTDIAPGYDHITSGIGAAMIGWYGCAMLCYVTPKEHLGLPNKKTSKPASSPTNSPPTPPTSPKATPAPNTATTPSPKPASSSAGKTSSTSLDPVTAREYHDETLPKDGAKSAHFCSMCGPHFCSMKITEDVRDYAAKQGISEERSARAWKRNRWSS
jgi:phosphomethylpyrimidine synthase